MGHRLANGRALEFNLAVRGRRYNEFLNELRTFHKTQSRTRGPRPTPSTPGTTCAVVARSRLVGAAARLHHVLAEAHLSCIIKVGLESPVLRHRVD